jgi:hypothetical protein
MELAKKSRFWHGAWFSIVVNILGNAHQVNLVSVKQSIGKRPNALLFLADSQLLTKMTRNFI